MPKYDSQLQDLSSKLANAKKILVALPSIFNVDKLAAALALGLTLKNSGKTVEIVSEGIPTVGNANLFGIGDIKNQIPTSGEGNFVIKLDGVVDSSGQLNTVPALEKLDWFPKGDSLNLVFHVVPGQRFQPTGVSSFHEDSGFEISFVIGASNLQDLGAIGNGLNSDTVINIDNNSANSNFGTINVVDPQTSSVSEVVTHILPSLGLALDQDSASNILAGIYEATSNMTQNINTDTFQAASQAMQAGGTPPVIQSQAPVQPVQPVQPEITQPQVQSQPVQSINFNSQPQPQQTNQNFQTVPQVEQPQPVQPVIPSQPEVVSVPSPANDLINNPFLNPNQAIIQGPGFAPAAPQPAAPFNQPQPAFGVDPMQPQPGFGQFSAPQPQPFNQPSPMQPSYQSGQPQAYTQPVQPQQSFPTSQPQPDTFQQPMQPQEQPQMPVIPQSQPGDATYDLRQIFQIPQMPEEPSRNNGSMQHAGLPTDNLKPQPVQIQPRPTAQQQSSQEEMPMREMVGSSNPEMDSNPTPDWLVPKIFKSGSLG